MLRRITSTACLSPKRKTSARTAISPIKVYGLRPSSPTKGLRPYCGACASCSQRLDFLDPFTSYTELQCGHFAHTSCSKDCQTCQDRTRAPDKVQKLRILRSKASSLFNVQSGIKDDELKILIPPIQTIIPRPGHELPQCINLSVQLVPHSEDIGSQAREMLVALQLKSDFSKPVSKIETENSMNSVIVLDLSKPLLTRRRYLAPRALASRLIANLRDGDHVSVITTLAGSDDGRVVITRSVVENDIRQALADVILNMRLDAAQYDIDHYASLSHAIAILDKCPRERRANIFFISDGLESTSEINLKMLHLSLRNADVGLHTIGIGAVCNSHLLRRLAHITGEGTYQNESQLDDHQMHRFLAELAAGSSFLPLRNICCDLKLFEGTTIREVKGQSLRTVFHSPQAISITEPRLGPFEKHDIMIVLQTAEAKLANTANAELETNALPNSVRLAELENLINTMPIRLMSCSTKYIHPFMHNGETVRMPVHNLDVRRSREAPMPSSPALVIQDARQIAVEMLIDANMALKTGRQEHYLTILRDTEQLLHSLCTEKDISSTSFEDLFTEISTLRFQTTPRFKLSLKRRQSVMPTSPAPIRSSVFSDTREVVKEIDAVADINPRSPQSAYYRSATKSNIPDLTQAREQERLNTDRLIPREMKRAKTPSAMDSPRLLHGTTEAAVNSPGAGIESCDALSQPMIEIPKITWQTPKLSRLPSSHEIRHIVRKSSSQHDIRKVEMNDDAARRQVRSLSVSSRLPPKLYSPEHIGRPPAMDDVARTLWKSHKAERGEDSMISDLEPLPDSRLCTTPSPMLDSRSPVSPGSPKDYFSNKLLRSSSRRSPSPGDSPLKAMTSRWVAQIERVNERAGLTKADGSVYSPSETSPKEPVAGVSNPYFHAYQDTLDDGTILEVSEPCTPSASRINRGDWSNL